MSHQRLAVPIVNTVSLPPAAPRAQLINIVKQTSPFEERVTRNGIQRDIHVVIKNSPFAVQIAVAKNCEIDLNHVAFEAALLYDTEGDKGVDFVKVKPIEYKCVPSEGGDQVTVELRIKVLTSQHEDMFFKVSIQGQDPVTKQSISNLRVITAPIKVISKPEQLKKRQPPPVANNNNNKKRTVNDMVVEAVTRIERQQADHTNMMEKLLELAANNSSPKRAHVEIPSWEFGLSRSQQGKEEPADFDSAFVTMLKLFASTDPNHRAEKVRRIVRTLSPADDENFRELVDMLTTEGLGQAPGREVQRPLMNSTSSLFGPTKTEYEKIDNIFFTSIAGYGATPNPLHSSLHSSVGSVSLGGSLDGDNGYSDFLSHSPPADPFLM